MTYSFTSRSGVRIERRTELLDFEIGVDFLVDQLDGQRGIFLSSGVEDPDRYSRLDFGFVDPPLELVSRDRRMTINALNPRGEILLRILTPAFTGDAAVEVVEQTGRRLILEVPPSTTVFPEEERSQQPSVFTPIRSLLADFEGIEDGFLGLYGAFGYDLIFQFEAMELTQDRSGGAKDMHLFLPDRIYALDRAKELARVFRFEFARDGDDTAGLPETPFAPVTASAAATEGGEITSDHTADAYMANVDAARERMHAGDIFEVVLSRKFTSPFSGAPSALYHLMRRVNPSPYEFFCQFGDEQLIGASPEMFVRIEGDRVESCPISGTIRRGENAMEDADRIKQLYNSDKDEVELTMCTDVDRNDKSRICVPGSVKLLTRRFIERYAGLFHTVDHVEGRLRPGFRGLDAFLSHMWAVTLTGAPKRMAVRLVEQMETSARGWYGGGIGTMLLNGDVNTGITIRTVHLHDGVADYRAGSTLVYDSIPADEEAETRVKATAFFNAMANVGKPVREPVATTPAGGYEGVSIVMVDNEDSFVHTLADYFRQTGADVRTYRAGTPFETLVGGDPDLVVHSPGPGRPADFGVPELVRRLAEHGVPQFGVCLGLQGIVEAFGGELAVLEVPRHGKTWTVDHDGSGIFDGLPKPCTVGAYHSLVAVRDALPETLDVTATNGDGLVMAVRHRSLPVQAVQFHPESILSMQAATGHHIVRNVLRALVDPARRGTRSAAE